MDKEPIRFETVRYRCPVCRKSYSSKSGALAHMQRCARDEDNKGCMTCLHDGQRHLRVQTERGPAVSIERLCECGAREYAADIVINCPEWEPRP